MVNQYKNSPFLQLQINGNKAGFDLVLTQPFLLLLCKSHCPYANLFFGYNFLKKRKKVCIKTRSTSAVH